MAKYYERFNESQTHVVWVTKGYDERGYKWYIQTPHQRHSGNDFFSDLEDAIKEGNAFFEKIVEQSSMRGLNAGLFRYCEMFDPEHTDVRAVYDCSSDGLSWEHDQVFVPLPDGLPWDGKTPIVVPRDRGDQVCFVPKDGSKGAGPMFGGTFVWDSDSRFRAVYPSPVPLHDRFERGS